MNIPPRPQSDLRYITTQGVLIATLIAIIFGFIPYRIWTESQWYLVRRCAGTIMVTLEHNQKSGEYALNGADGRTALDSGADLNEVCRVKK